MTIADVRNEFPALQNQVFLDSACFSLAPQRSIDKVCAFLDMAASWPSGSASQQHLDMDAMRSAARPPLAKLINATEDDIALMESTTHVALLNFPQEQEVLVSSRYTSGVGGVRVACHLFNNREDIGRLVEVTAECVRRRAKAST